MTKDHLEGSVVPMSDPAAFLEAIAPYWGIYLVGLPSMLSAIWLLFAPGTVEPGEVFGGHEQELRLVIMVAGLLGLLAMFTAWKIRKPHLCVATFLAWFISLGMMLIALVGQVIGAALHLRLPHLWSTVLLFSQVGFGVWGVFKLVKSGSEVEHMISG